MDQEKIFKFIVENSHQAILLLDLKGKVIYANPMNKKVLGYDSDELIGKSINELISEEDQKLAENLLNFSAGSKKKDIRVECRLEEKEGNTKWVELVSNNMLDDKNFGAVILTFNDITSSKTSEEKLHQLAFHDSLSGITNRRLFRDRLKHAVAHAKRNQKNVGVILIDLDMMSIEDAVDADIEEEILKEAGHRLVKCLRQTDTVSREGSDEFNIILSDITNEEDTVIVAKKIFSTLSEPITVGKKKYKLSPHLGFSTFPSDAQDYEQLIMYADIAASEAKNQDKDIIRISTSSLRPGKGNTSANELKEFINNFK